MNTYKHFRRVAFTFSFNSFNVYNSNIVCRNINHISQITTSNRRKISASYKIASVEQVQYSRIELDTHADSIVAGANCCIMHYTGRVCDVSPYRDDYSPIKNVPIVKAATSYQSKHTGQVYILIFNEALWMGDSMKHSLINPNQLRHHGVTVQDNPFSTDPLFIANEDQKFNMELMIEGTTIFANTFTPSEKELNTCPHIVLSSPHEWDPKNVTFPASNITFEEKMYNYNISSIQNDNYNLNITNDDLLFDLSQINTRIINSVQASHCDTISSFTYNVSSLKTNGDKNKTIKDTNLVKTLDIGNNDIPLASTFQSSERHSDVSPENLSERWFISIKTAKETLKRTTQKFLRSAILPLSRRYRADRMFHIKRLQGEWSTDTLDGRTKSLDGNRYAQVFANKEYFAKIYPMDSKAKAGDALKVFCREFGVPDHLTFDGSGEQNGKNTTFMKQIRKHNIDHHTTEANLHQQNPAEGVIRELRKKWYRVMVRKQVPTRLWDYGMKWCADIMSLTHTSAGDLNGCIPLSRVTGETPDISEFLDFGFYDYVWYRDNAGLGPQLAGRWLGVAESRGNLMCYNIINQNGKVVARSSVQRVTQLELQTTEYKTLFEALDKSIKERLNIKDRSYAGAKPNPEDWADLIEKDPEFNEEFNKIFNDSNIPEADEFTPEVLDDTYLNMELALSRDGDGPEFARVTKRLRDANGLPIGTANDNPLLDTRLYEVEYADGYKASLAANTIAINMFAQVDAEGNRHVLFDEIIDHRTDGSEIKSDNAFITSNNGGRRRKETTKGWELLVQWKDGSTTWEKLKDMKECYPVQVSEYSVQAKISNEPAFAWWVSHTLKKRQQIVAKVKSKYWTRTHKFGIRIPKSVKEAKELDQQNGNTLWWDAILKEMANVRIAFELFEGEEKDIPPGYQQVKCHIVFDIKMGENFRRKARMVAGGHTTETPAVLTYSSVVSRDSVRIALTIAALNDLKVLSCDIQNAYLTAKCREKIWTRAGPEFGSDQGKIMIIVRALYGLKSSGAAFRALLAEVLHDLNYRPSKADPDVYMRPAVKEDGFQYYEYVLTYVDDVLCISHKPMTTMKGLQGRFKLKDDKIEEPEVYLGASLSKMQNESGYECWAMSSDKYCAAAVANVSEVLEKKGLRLPSKCLTPLSNGYRPELDVSPELKADGVQYYQELVGVLRWAVEIGRVDILLEVSMMSTHLALPRQGHLEQVLHIFGYLKSHKKLRLLFDSDHPQISPNRFKSYDWFDFYRDAEEAIPPNMPEPRGLPVSTSAFVDADLAGDRVNRRSQTGILIFCNRAPIHWYSKRQPSVESSTFGAEFRAMKTAVEMVEALRYKLRMFGVPIDGPTNIFCDNEAVYQNTVVPESTLAKKHHSIAYHRCREAVAAKTIQVAKEGTEHNLADLFTKVMASPRRTYLLDRFTY